MSEYDLGYERGQLRAEEELRRAGFVEPLHMPTDDESDRGYVDGWDDVASRSPRRRPRLLLDE